MEGEMKKYIFNMLLSSLLVLVLAAACGGGGSEEPVSDADADGQGPADTGDTELPDTGDTELPDTGDSQPDGDTGDTQPVTGECTPGKEQKCDYNGPEGTEGIGICKAAVRTCKDDKKWGPCVGEVIPVVEKGELCDDGLDNDCDGKTDIGGSCGGGDTGDSQPDGDALSDTGDSGYFDSGETGSYIDAYKLPEDEDICTATCDTLVLAACMDPIESEFDAGLCNGLDDDCDGVVDEGCSCKAGQTQPCFMGPPNYFGLGSCTAKGVQTCIVNLKDGKAVSGKWGECIGGSRPGQDVCDNSDNNCNGCVDDGLCCTPPIDCSYDIGTAKPFTDKIINGLNFYGGPDPEIAAQKAAESEWTWTLSKGPCDTVLNKTSFSIKGAQTLEELAGDGDALTEVSGLGLSQFKVNFQLSGSYTLHVSIKTPDGKVVECSWVIKVVSEGLRVELCWDRTGAVDLDLHLQKVGLFTGWSDDSTCYYNTCRMTGYQANYTVNWGYADTVNEDETTSKNPRLDLDNINTVGKPENVNLDNPADGDRFRIGVNYFDVSTTIETYPVVNVYCGGTLKATYGVAPKVFPFDETGVFWKVAEVTWSGDAESDECELEAPYDDMNGYILGLIDDPGW